MSYLNVPRIHFAGTVQADPSTVNNNDANFDPTVALSEVAPNPNDPANTSVYWNPYGTHNWKISGCTVRGAVNDQGQFIGPGTDPVVGAEVLSSGQYPAKIVDLDPDNQGVSQIWGLEFQISIPDPSDSTKVLASVTGTMPPTAFADLWNRTTNAPQPGMSTMSASFQAVLTDIVWVNQGASAVLSALQQLSPTAISIRFHMDSFQPDSNQSNFTFGRIVGTIGPALAQDAPRSTPRRLAPPAPQSGPPFFTSFGPVGCVWVPSLGVLTMDLGNCIPTNGTPPASGPTVPVDGWPIVPTTVELSFGTQTSAVHLKSGVPNASPVSISIPFDNDTYLIRAGIVDVPIAASDVAQLLASPLTLTVAGTQQIVAQEDPQGRYVDVDIPFFRLNPGEAGTVTLWATQFGQPWVGAQLDVGQVPFGANGPQWQVGIPTSAVVLSSGAGGTVTTSGNGTAPLTLTAGNPGTPRVYSDGEPGPDGQVYQVSGSWQNWGGIFLFAGAPINLLVFSSYPMPAKPTWTANVGPILSNYARMYPYMKGIIDLADYGTVTGEQAAIQYVLNLPVTDPHHMPIVRDLSGDKLAMINEWFAQGMPE